MIQIQEKKLCCGCHGCVQICPKQCIEMVADAEGFLYPKVDESRCVQCGLCKQVCPVLNAQPDDLKKRPDAFAAINLDEAIRMESSSGGIFTLLAQQVISRGGVVFGAAWTEDHRSEHHIAVRTYAELAKLRGSKYLQSIIENSYAQVEESLREGEYVLFSGTPCQVEGLRCFLGRDYENLLCVDLICHGVPSPHVWGKYLKECEKAAVSEAVVVNFRDKCTNWKEFSLSITMRNGKIIYRSLSEDPYMRAFLQNACLRPSCYACVFKKKNRRSDLTLADFWGVEKICPQMDDNRGTSLVLIHSRAGKEAMSGICTDVLTEEVDLEKAISENTAFMESVYRHKNREAFLQSLDSMTVAEAVKRWLPIKVSPKEQMYIILKKTGMVDIVKKLLGRK